MATCLLHRFSTLSYKVTYKLSNGACKAVKLFNPSFRTGTYDYNFRQEERRFNMNFLLAKSSGEDEIKKKKLKRKLMQPQTNDW